MRLSDNPQLFWNKYKEFKIAELSKTKYKEIYLQNLDKFISPAVSLTYIIINKPNPGDIKISSDSLHNFLRKSNFPDSSFAEYSSEIRNKFIQQKIDNYANNIKSQLFMNFYDLKKIK